MVRGHLCHILVGRNYLVMFNFRTLVSRYLLVSTCYHPPLQVSSSGTNLWRESHVVRHLNEVCSIAKEMLSLFWTRGNTSLLECRLPHYCQVLASFCIHVNGGEKNVLLSVLTWGKWEILSIVFNTTNNTKKLCFGIEM